MDGCKGGWIVASSAIDPASAAVQYSANSTGQLSQSVGLFRCEKFSDVLDVTEHCDLVLVDMPIGLSDGRGLCNEGHSSFDWPRQCDLLAKEALKGKRSSLFLAPPRGCLCAENPRAFQDSHRKLVGVGASLPVWGIVPKIIEVDKLMNPEVQRRVHEYHPELAWCRLAGKGLSKKRSVEGRSERWELLQQWMEESSLQQARQWRQSKSSQVAEDDLLDALVGLVVCLTFGQFRLCGEPPSDSQGLTMEILY